MKRIVIMLPLLICVFNPKGIQAQENSFPITGNATLGSENLIGFKRADGGLVYGIGHINNEFRIGSSANLGPTAGTPINISSGNVIKLTTQNQERVRISANGYVGIGTSSPSEQLHVVGHIYLQGTEQYASGWDKTYFNFKGHSLIFGSPVGTYAHNRIELKPGGSPKGLLNSSLQMYNALDENEYDLKVMLSTNGDSYLNGGNVGIGTDDPDAKLAVKGLIHTQEVKVDLNGAVAPDFVFDHDYKLRTLQETEEYINQNRHLPEIPSATEMEKDGFELKEMNLKLLQKIEELTLHLIDQNKQLTLQNEKLEKQQQEIQVQNMTNEQLKERMTILEKQLQILINKL